MGRKATLAVTQHPSQKNMNEAPPRLVLFFGSGRSGSTLLGQMLNYHPHCLIANEYKLLDRVLKGASLAGSLDELKTLAQSQYKTGLEADSRFKNAMSKYQKRWKAMGPLSGEEAFRKKEILVVGDKKAGKNSLLYQKDPEGVLALMDRMEKEYGLYLIQLVRDPLRSARSYMKSHGYRFAEAYHRVVVDQTATYELLEQKKDSCAVHRLFYEDLIEDPARELTVLLGWLGLERHEDWTNRIATVVDRSEDQRPRRWKEYVLMLKEGWAYRHSPVFDRYDTPGRF